MIFCQSSSEYWLSPPVFPSFMVTAFFVICGDLIIWVLFLITHLVILWVVVHSLLSWLRNFIILRQLTFQITSFLLVLIFGVGVVANTSSCQVKNGHVTTAISVVDESSIPKLLSSKNQCGLAHLSLIVDNKVGLTKNFRYFIHF